MAAAFKQAVNFSEYITTCRQQIAAARKPANGATLSQIITANAPKQHLAPGKGQCALHGVILVHGLFDSTSVMDSLFQALVTKGYSVYSLLLPGHGTTPSDLLHIRMEDWLLCLRFAIACFKAEGMQHISLMGLSTGASLSLRLCLDGLPIDSVVAFAPAFKIKPPLTCLGPILAPLRHCLPFIKRAAETDYAKYQSYTLNSVIQVQRLATRLNHQLKQKPLTTACLMVLTDNDETICSNAAKRQFYRFRHPNNQLLVYSNQTPVTKNPRLTTVGSCLPQEHILDFSHPCLPVSPSHPHYGRQGDYPATADNQAGLPPRYKGSLSLHNLRHYPVQRLLYNPFFDDMFQQIDAFLTKTRTHTKEAP